MSDDPLAYLITFRSYGTWLHGDDRGSTDREHRTWSEPHLPPDVERRNIALSRLAGRPVTLTSQQRDQVADVVRQQCAHRGWTLQAINVRTEHLHVVLTAPVKPELVMNTLKAYSTRSLKRSGLWSKTYGPWSRHGSTRYLWSEDSVARACAYVNDMQTLPPPYRDRQGAPYRDR